MNARTSIRRGDHIEFSYYLIFDVHGGVRVTRTPPSTNSHERSMHVISKIPLSAFRVPQLRATITVEESDIGPLEAKVDAAAEQLKATLGVDFDIQIRKQDAS